MKYSRDPQGFKVAHWRHLYDACIPSPDALTKLRDVIFVAFDAEPWSHDNSRPAELGISMLRMSDAIRSVQPTSLATLDHFVKTCAVETHQIQVGDIERPRRCESNRFGIEHTIAAEDVEQQVMRLVDSYRKRFKDDSEIIFVAFDIQYEFRLLSTMYTDLTSCFDYWLDVQEFARLASGVDRPGLSETLRACGFGQQDKKDLHSLQGRHRAATDTVRTAAVLHHLLSPSTAKQHMEIAVSARNRSTLTRKQRAQPKNDPAGRNLWSGTRPKPRELYPYTAIVRSSAGQVPIPSRILEIFAGYDPIAVGASRQNRYGWVCLSSLNCLDEFIQQINGSKDDQGGNWTVVSDFDPKIIPAKNMHELKQRLHSRAGEKREERRLKELENMESLTAPLFGEIEEYIGDLEISTTTDL